MAQNFIEFESNAEEFSQIVGKALDRATDLRVPFGLIARSQFKFERLIFQNSTGPGQFPDLSDGYKRQKIGEVGFAYPILFKTGKLARSLLQPGGENITNIGPTSLEMGTQVPYASVHQFGLDGIPTRKFLFIDFQRRRAWKLIIENNLKKAFQIFKG